MSTRLIIADNNVAMDKLIEEQQTYDLIFADVPYNQKAKRRKTEYNDSFENHEQYVEFMRPRFEKAKQLLSDTGLFVVMVGNYEQAYLTLLLNEIFGENNRLNTIVIESALVAGVLSGPSKYKLSNSYFFALVYAKNKKNINNLNILRTKAENPFDPSYNIILKNDLKPISTLKYVEQTLGNWFPKNTKITNELVNAIMQVNKDFKEEFYNKITPYQYKLETSKKVKKEKVLHDPDTFFEQDGELLYKTKTGQIRYLIPFSKKLKIIDGELCNTTIRGDTWTGFYRYKNSLEKESGVSFVGQKPVVLLQDFVYWINNINANVLDIFAGTGATAHAVKLQNEIDGGNRNCTLIQIHEKIEKEDEFEYVDEKTEYGLNYNKISYTKEIID